MNGVHALPLIEIPLQIEVVVPYKIDTEIIQGQIWSNKVRNVGLRLTFESDPNVDAKVATVIVYEASVSVKENHEESECIW